MKNKVYIYDSYSPLFKDKATGEYFSKNFMPGEFNESTTTQVYVGSSTQIKIAEYSTEAEAIQKVKDLYEESKNLGLECHDWFTEYLNQGNVELKVFFENNREMVRVIFVSER